MVVDQRGQDGPHVVGTHSGVDAQHQRHPPASRLRQSAVEETQNVRRHSEIQFAAVVARQPAGRVPRHQGVGQCGQAAVVVEVLRGEFHAFVGRGHRDADRQQRVAADLEEVVRRVNRLHPEATGPDSLQGVLHLYAGVRGAAVLAAGRLGLGSACPVPGCRPRSTRGRVVGFDPKACSGKGIAGQRDPLGSFALQRAPIHVHSGRPQLSQREQERVPVVAALEGVAHQAHRTVGVTPTGHAHGRAGQAPTGAHLDEHPERVGEQCLEFIGEAHGGADLPGPSIRVGGLLVGHPGAGHVGQHRDSGRMQLQS